MAIPSPLDAGGGGAGPAGPSGARGDASRAGHRVIILSDRRLEPTLCSAVNARENAEASAGCQVFGGPGVTGGTPNAGTSIFGPTVSMAPARTALLTESRYVMTVEIMR